MVDMNTFDPNGQQEEEKPDGGAEQINPPNEENTPLNRETSNEGEPISHDYNAPTEERRSSSPDMPQDSTSFDQSDKSPTEESQGGGFNFSERPRPSEDMHNGWGAPYADNNRRGDGNYNAPGWSNNAPDMRDRPQPGGWQYGRQGRYQQGYNNYNGGYYNSDNQGYNNQMQNRDNYTWNFEDYQSSQALSGRKSKGAAAFGMVVAAVLMFAVIILALFGLYSIFSNSNKNIDNSQSASSGETYPQLNLRDKPADINSNDQSGELSTSQIAAKVGASVVGIATFTSENSVVPTNEGSGIIMNAEGHIITNAHVVANATAVSVVMSNGETYPGKIIGLDERMDLAVVKIDAENLSYAEFGNSDQLVVGEKAVAIGNPGGAVLAGTVTQGCISAVNRPLKTDGLTFYYLQTDAAINPGNSGGPLLNSYGQVVGINSSKIIASGYEGIGFAIPINDAKPIVDQIIKNGRVTRAVIGITGYEITSATSQRNDLPKGIYVSSIKEGTDIATKDVKEGDVVTHINGSAIETFDDINEVLRNKKPGDTITLTIFRDGTNGAEDSSYDITIALSEDTPA